MTYNELKQRQSWTLKQKIDHAVGVLSAFMVRMNGKIYLSYSGGKDSGVMLDIVRRFVDKTLPALFCNTGNEYPEVAKFLRQTENLVTIRPNMRIEKIIEKYGFPLVSKEQSRYIYQAGHTNTDRSVSHYRHNGKRKQAATAKIA